MLQKLKDAAGSKRFWVGFLGCALTYINAQVKFLDDTQMAGVVAMIMTYIGADTLRPTTPTAPAPK